MAAIPRNAAAAAVCDRGDDVAIEIPSTAAGAQAMKDSARRRRGGRVTARREAAPQSAFKPSLMEAGTRSDAALKLLVRNHVTHIIQPTVVVAYVSLSSAVYVIACTPYWMLGAFFFLVTVVLEGVFLTLYLCTCFERTRAFLASLFGLKQCQDGALIATGRRSKSRAGRPKPSRLRATVVDTPAGTRSIDLCTGPHTKWRLSRPALCDDLHRS
ncbi:hypothetical protein MRX96_009541 [Rhipicephalus microplus]